MTTVDATADESGRSGTLTEEAAAPPAAVVGPMAGDPAMLGLGSFIVGSVTLGLALVGFVAILFQINEIRSNNRAVSARQAFLGYTDLAFKNPKFSAPDYDGIKAGGRDEQVQYERFVSYFLYACEEAISA